MHTIRYGLGTSTERFVFNPRSTKDIIVLSQAILGFNTVGVVILFGVLNVLYFELAMVVLLGGLLIRILPVIRGRILGVDAFYHLLVARVVNETHELPESVDSFVVHGVYSYPPMFHAFLSLLVRRVPERFLRSLCALIDILHAILIFAFAWSFIGPVGSLIAMTAYLFTPICVAESLSLTPRSLGSLWISCTLFALILSTQPHLQVFFVVASSVSFALVLLTHKLATQALLIIFIAEIVFLMAIGGPVAVALLIVVLGIGLALLFSKWHYLSVLREHLAYLRFHGSYGSLFDSKKRFGNIVRILAIDDPWLILAGLGVTIWLVNVGVHSRLDPRYTIIGMLAVWAFASTALAYFWRYGDGERHVLYSVAPGALLIGASFDSSLLPFGIIVYASFVAYCSLVIGVSRKRLSRPFVVPRSLVACFEYLSVPPPKIIMTIPMAYAYAAAYYTHQIIAAGDASIKGLEYGANVLKHALNDYDLLKQTLAELKVTHLVVEGQNDFVIRLQIEGTAKQEYRRDDYVVYRVVNWRQDAH